MKPHYVYLANSSEVKVGITRERNIPYRWIDQGASQGLPIMKVQTRYQSGLLEKMFTRHISDKTNWRKMLQGDADPVDLEEIREELFETCADQIDDLMSGFGGDIVPLDEEESHTIRYPVRTYPTKIKSLNLDKTPVIQDTLEGIKGQYLILAGGVLNVRKYTGYEVTVSL